MKVSIIGGTGKLGLAFAVRLLSTGHEVMIGSRDAAKAIEAAKIAGDQVKAGTNAEAARWCELAVISVPYASHRTILEPLKEDLRNKLIIDATVPVDPSNMLQIKTETGKSAAEEAAAIMGEADVFGAFQTISHRLLRNPEATDHDVLVAGPENRKNQILDLIRAMRLRPVNAGPIEVSAHLERMTVLLLSINKANKVKESGIKITG